MSDRVVTFGEIMLRLSPPGFLRFGQAASFDVTYGGGEANVAVSLARFGAPVDYVTRLPENDLGDAVVGYLRQQGVGTGKIIRGGERLGVYFIEIGAVHRPSKVIYDRSGSSLAAIERGMVDWDSVLDGASWFHTTGITPAISRGAADACLEGLEAARGRGITVSLDLNYRAKLWKWGQPAGEVMAGLARLADVAIGNEEDADKVFGIRAPGVDVTSGRIEPQRYRAVAEGLMERFPNLKKVAITLRKSISASHNDWTGVLHDGREYRVGRTYAITHIVDRVGGGDAFAAGLIHGLRTLGDDQKALEFAVAASCLKHTIFGDANLVGVADVERLMGGAGSGRVLR